MEYQGNYRMPEYFKIMLVSLKPDGCRILKGPREEKKLAEILRDDFHIGRYEKMIQLVVREMVEENDRERILRLLSPDNLRERFRSGETKVTCSYLRIVDGKMQRVSAAVFPRRFGEQGEVEEFMIYVSAGPGISHDGSQMDERSSTDN